MPTPTSLADWANLAQRAYPLASAAYIRALAGRLHSRHGGPGVTVHVEDGEIVVYESSAKIGLEDGWERIPA